MKPISSNIRDAKTLKGDFYTSEDYLENSKFNIFEKSWQLLSDNSHLKFEGSQKPVQFLEPLIAEPLVLIKQKDLSIKCLSNVCTHRGNILINNQTKAKEIVCKYHGRRFNNCGKLLSMPEFSDVNNFPSENDNLTELPIKNWKQFLFSSLIQSINLKSLLKKWINVLDGCQLKNLNLIKVLQKIIL